MGVPKRRHSKARKNMRRSIWAQMEAPGLTVCPQCHEFKQPHRVCPSCGYYKNRTVVESAAE
ncbi:50S ribosomal protein L32 [Bacillota bacterium LX-D]|nr:50S ribosomal protein L32 [Bacillota bacterium LX-D]